VFFLGDNFEPSVIRGQTLQLIVASASIMKKIVLQILKQKQTDANQRQPGGDGTGTGTGSGTGSGPLQIF
jgi:hypothetical protein